MQLAIGEEMRFVTRAEAAASKRNAIRCWCRGCENLLIGASSSPRLIEPTITRVAGGKFRSRMSARITQARRSSRLCDGHVLALPLQPYALRYRR